MRAVTRLIEIKAMSAGTVVEDKTGLRLVKRTRGWVLYPTSDGTSTWSDEEVHELGGVTVLSVIYDDPDDITVDMEFILQGQQEGWAGYDGPESLRLYFMSDGTVRWQRP